MNIISSPAPGQVCSVLKACDLPSEDIEPAFLENFFLLSDGETNLGVVGLQLYPGIGLLRSLAVMPGQRRRGLGTKLVRVAEDRARSRGVRFLYLLTKDAHAFFTKLGYAEVDRTGAPESIRSTAQFGSHCCSCAALLRKDLAAQDPTTLSAEVFNKLATVYREKFMDLTLYDEFYGEFCDGLRPGPARVLDVACGPGNVSRYLMARRPQLDLLGIDLAPRMVELARGVVPTARFAVHDCRNLFGLNQSFDGIICAFGLPYISLQDAADFIRAAAKILEPNGLLFLSLILGNIEDSGFTACSSGDLIYMFYHEEKQIIGLLQEHGLTVLKQCRIPSPDIASKKTTDLVVIAKK